MDEGWRWLDRDRSDGDAPPDPGLETHHPARGADAPIEVADIEGRDLARRYGATDSVRSRALARR